ncbi:MAG: V-type ATP synthase subunit D [Actinomycetota bacterium]|nr:V-type ATP synthase subunit D [Actinomycetota bacterium]
MEELHTTRTELLQRRQQIDLAQQGRDLLEKKRDALLMEFMKIMGEVLGLSGKLRRTAAEANFSLAVAQAVDGTVNLRSAAMATHGEITVEITGTHIMGVPIPEVARKNVRRTALERGYGIIGSSSRIDEVAEKFEEELNVIIQMAAIETKLRRLGAEIQKTRRRVNALDQVVIPTLKEQVRYISMALDERSREDLFRLKKVKKTLEAKKAAV